MKYLTVVVDYFTKWIEAEPVTTISAERIKPFYWKKIICRFGLLAEIVSDNGTQFASWSTANFCTQLKIKQLFTSMEHPQSNGQAEVANKIILRGLRRHLGEAKGRWVEELPQVLWSYHTTPHSSTKETPFRLTYDMEAVVPMEIGEPSPLTTRGPRSGTNKRIHDKGTGGQAIVQEVIVPTRESKREPTAWSTSTARKFPEHGMCLIFHSITIEP
ncbi:Tf2-8, partial [Mucuna pruriens]